MSVLIVSDNVSLANSFAEFVAKQSALAIAENGRFTVAVSGGSLPKLMAAGLKQEPYLSSVEWSKWHVLLADERFVPLDHADSNYCLIKAELLAKVPAVAKVYPIVFSGTVEDCAMDYQCQLKGLFGDSLPSIDLILLGMGPDGHTCSLFPGHQLLQEQGLWVSSLNDSPKPPPSRITLTYPVLNNAKAVAFVCTGAGKADVLKNIHKENNSNGYPAGRVMPKKQPKALFWFMDTAAASKL